MAMPRFLRLAEVLRLTQLSKASVYRKIRRGTFPAQVKVGRRGVRWRADEVREWLDTRPRAQ